MLDSGAHYYRCDFQVHTPRDNGWSGKRAVTDEERRQFADDLVAECRRIRLDAIAVTDHHDFVMVPFVRQAAAEERGSDGNVLQLEQRLVVYPGLELTLGVPCQALLILDADFPDDRLDGVLTTLAIEAHASAEASLPPVQVISHQSLPELHRVLDGQAWLKGRYIIFPNVTDGGHKTLMRSGMGAKYKEMPCVGGYLDGSVNDIGDGNKNIFAGLDQNYGNKRLAVVQTSDSRHEDFRDLGKHSTWIKWAEPTAEALRQACLASESRIAQTLPELPTIWVSHISVSNSKFLGMVDLAFNPQFNAIIGGRGTGKSTLLDYVRWALCDQPPEVPSDEELADPSSRRRRLIADTLAPFDGHIDLRFTINGIEHVVRRHAASGDVELRVGNKEFEKVSEADVRSLLPIQAYSQKQLSSVSVRLDELTRFVTAPIRRRLDELDTRMADAGGRVRQNYGVLLRKRALKTSIERERLTEKSLSEQTENLRGSLDTVSAEDRAVLNAKPSYDAALEALNSWDRGLDDARDMVNRLSGAVQQTLSGLVEAPDDAYEAINGLRDADRLTRQALSTLASAVVAAGSELASVRSSDQAEGDAFDIATAAIETFEGTYADVRQRSSKHEAKLTELAQLEERQKASRRAMTEQARQLTDLGDPESEHAKLMTEMSEFSRQRANLLEAECVKVSELSEGLLRATLTCGQGFNKVDEQLRAATAGSNIRGARFDAVFEALVLESDPLESWQRVLDELDQLAGTDEPDAVTSEVTPTLARLGLPIADIRRAATKLTPEGWLGLALTPITDQPHFEYQTKNGTFIEFTIASAGQQATALLRVLLAQPGPPLVIDQPEDDLDSQVVQDIVGRIWRAKNRRQLLFTSHNANLVVNGDADLVVCCDYRTDGDQSGGRLKAQGAIDVSAIREEIARVMEGGEKAFRLRKEKYGF